MARALREELQHKLSSILGESLSREDAERVCRMHDYLSDSEVEGLLNATFANNADTVQTAEFVSSLFSDNGGERLQETPAADIKALQPEVAASRAACRLPGSQALGEETSAASSKLRGEHTESAKETKPSPDVDEMPAPPLPEKVTEPDARADASSDDLDVIRQVQTYSRDGWKSLEHFEMVSFAALEPLQTKMKGLGECAKSEELLRTQIHPAADFLSQELLEKLMPVVLQKARAAASFDLFEIIKNDDKPQQQLHLDGIDPDADDTSLDRYVRWLKIKAEEAEDEFKGMLQKVADAINDSGTDGDLRKMGKALELGEEAIDEVVKDFSVACSERQKQGKSLGALKLIGPNCKSYTRMMEKARQAKGWKPTPGKAREAITDPLRAKFESEDPVTLALACRLVSACYKVTRVVNRMTEKNPKQPININTNLELPSGLLTEVQYVLTDIGRLQHALHGCYELKRAKTLIEAVEVIIGKPPVIVAIGEVGMGKSALCKAITGSDVFVSNSTTSSVTQNTQAVQGERWLGKEEESKVIVVDTPGLADHAGDYRHVFEMVEVLRKLGKLHSIVLVLNSEMCRLTQHLLDQLKLFHDALGSGIWHNLCIAFTRWYMGGPSRKRRHDMGESEKSFKEKWTSALRDKFTTLDSSLDADNTLPAIFIDSGAIIERDRTPSEEVLHAESQIERLKCLTFQLTPFNAGQVSAEFLEKSAEELIRQTLESPADAIHAALTNAGKLKDVCTQSLQGAMNEAMEKWTELVKEDLEARMSKDEFDVLGTVLIWRGKQARAVSNAQGLKYVTHRVNSLRSKGEQEVLLRWSESKHKKDGLLRWWDLVTSEIEKDSGSNLLSCPTRADLTKAVLQHMLTSGFALSELRDIGFNPEKLGEAGFSVDKLTNMDFQAQHCREFGFMPADFLRANINLKEAGFMPADIVRANMNLKEAGFTPQECADGGVALKDMLWFFALTEVKRVFPEFPERCFTSAECKEARIRVCPYHPYAGVHESSSRRVTSSWESFSRRQEFSAHISCNACKRGLGEYVVYTDPACAAADSLISSRILGKVYANAGHEMGLFSVASLWSSAYACIAFLREQLPIMAQWCHNDRPPQVTAREWLLKIGVACPVNTAVMPVNLLIACARDDAELAEDALSQDGSLVCASPGMDTPLAVAARFGNVRVIKVLMQHGAHPGASCPQSGRSAIYWAAAGLYLPALEALLDRPAPEWNLETDFAMLPSSVLSPLKQAHAAYVIFLTEESRSQTALRTAGLGFRCVAGERITGKALEQTVEGPTGLCHPDGAQEEFLTSLTELEMHSGDPRPFVYVAHAWKDDDHELKAKRIAASVQHDELCFLDRLCTPQWDITLKQRYIRGSMCFLRKASRMLLVASEQAFKRWWALEDVLLFAKLHGLGSIWVAATAEDAARAGGSLPDYMRSLLPARDADFGAEGGLNRSMLSKTNIFTKSSFPEPWQDPEFSPGDKILWKTGMPTSSRESSWSALHWQPVERSSIHRLFPEGSPSPNDVQQGNVGNCAFMAVLCAIAHAQPVLLMDLFESDSRSCRSFEGWACKLFRDGTWQTLILDTFLPRFEGQLEFARLGPRKALWPVVLEKAWAKVHGSYSSMKRGCAANAFQHLSGELPVELCWESSSCTRAQVATMMILAGDCQKWPMCISSNRCDFGSGYERVLQKGHVYAVLDAAKAGDGTDGTLLLQDPRGESISLTWATLLTESSSVSVLPCTSCEGLAFPDSDTVMADMLAVGETDSRLKKWFLKSFADVPGTDETKLISEMCTRLVSKRSHSKCTQISEYECQHSRIDSSSRSTHSIGKLCTSAKGICDAEREMMTRKGMKVEGCFYKDPRFAASIKRHGLPIPDLIFQSWSADADWCCYMLSDLRDDFPVSLTFFSFVGSSWELKALLDWVARFHALFWDCPDLYHFDLWQSGWNYSLDKANHEQSIWGPMQSNWQQSMQHYIVKQGEWEDCVRLSSFAQRLALAAAGVHKALQNLAERHPTLLHGDLSPAHCFFSRQKGQDTEPAYTECAVCDFQYVGIGCVGSDLARILEPLTPEAQNAALDFYFSRLKIHLSGERGTSFSRQVLQLQFEFASLDFLRYRLCGTWQVRSQNDLIRVLKAEDFLHTMDGGEAQYMEEYVAACFSACSASQEQHLCSESNSEVSRPCEATKSREVALP